MIFKKNNLKKPFFIAEAGSNFNQSLEIGKKLIYIAKVSGASAIKFQLFNSKVLYPNNKKMFKIFKQNELSKTMFKKFKLYGDKIKIDVFASAFDIGSLKFLEKCRVKYHKVASSELTNLKLINYLSKIKKPIILSTGMAELNDIQNAIDILSKKNQKLIILQCGAVYPLKYNKNNLNVLKVYKKFKFPIGLSDHSLDNIAAITAVGLGAQVFEKHFTLSKKMIGPDHSYAMEPKELKNYFTSLRRAFLCLGSKKKKLLFEEKSTSRRKGLYFKNTFKKGQKLKKRDFALISPPLGLLPNNMDKILSKKLSRNVKKNNPVFLKDFK